MTSLIVHADGFIFTTGLDISLVPDEVLLYIRNLEDRVGQLETGTDFPFIKAPNPLPTKSKEEEGTNEDGGVRPESVSNALKLERSLDSDGGGEGDLGDGEKAFVREMCNVSMGAGVRKRTCRLML